MKNDERQSESTDFSSTGQPVFSMDILSDPDRQFRDWLIVSHMEATGFSQVGLTSSEEMHTIGKTGTFNPAA